MIASLPFGRRASRLIERNLLVYRRGWIIIFSGFFEPFFYLLGIGFGIGSLVGNVSLGAGHSVPYAVFVAPALMAGTAMNGALYDSTFNLFFKLRYAKTYDAVLATPLGVADVALGEVTWALMRGSLYSLGFLVVMAALGLVISPWALLALPAATLIGFSSAAVGTVATTFMRKWQDFDLVIVVTLPLLLFSATFFPISVYPAPLQAFVQLTPLYHGVDLIRGLTTGNLGPGLLVDVGYLVLLGAFGLAITSRRLQHLLLK
ncbi:MAG: ABC transporter [Chloroflexi bacterium]|nr:MAG: ABC transporter [Chloroflexota bacterium]TME17886.1 MAG: ABC transporter [Chloroflexota bacterium]